MPRGGGGLDASILELGLRHPPQAGPPRDHAALAAAEGSLSAAPAVDAVLRLMAQGYSSPPGRSNRRRLMLAFLGDYVKSRSAQAVRYEAAAMDRSVVAFYEQWAPELHAELARAQANVRGTNTLPLGVVCRLLALALEPLSGLQLPAGAA